MRPSSLTARSPLTWVLCPSGMSPPSKSPVRCHLRFNKVISCVVHWLSLAPSVWFLSYLSSGPCLDGEGHLPNPELRPTCPDVYSSVLTQESLSALGWGWHRGLLAYWTSVLHQNLKRPVQTLRLWNSPSTATMFENIPPSGLA